MNNSSIRTSLVAAITLALALVACSTSNKATKGSSAKGADAKGAGQKAGATAESDRSMATSDGPSFEEVTCDETDEGLAWCDDDHTVVFCTAGVFYSLDCTTIGGDACGELDETVDCYAL